MQILKTKNCGWGERSWGERIGRTRGMCSTSTLERLKDQKIGQKSMTIICTALPGGRKSTSNMNANRCSRYCLYVSTQQAGYRALVLDVR